MATPSRASLRAGYVVDVPVGEALTLQPGPETRTIVVTLLEKAGRKARLRVQTHESVVVSRTDAETLPSAS